MTSIPVATFLAGSLLSLLLPVLIFLAILYWYIKFIKRVPETADGSTAEATPTPPGDAAAPPSEH